MFIAENISLKQFNTFGIDVKARQFARFNHVEVLRELLTHGSGQPTLILGGGSNILFTKDFDGLVLKNEITGIEKTGEDDEFVYLKAGAGESWHRVVLYCLEHNYAGVENLSLIPGSAGASPMQNIGAYGVELSEVFHELTAFHLQDKKKYIFNKEACAFGYRDSVFKGKYRGQLVILDVTYQLRKKPVFKTSYGAIEKELESMGVKELNIRAVSDAVIRIRTSKLPDPAKMGNAGSFFKNPAVSKEKFDLLKQEFPSIVGYNNNDGSVKLAAGWLIEQCGWKGYRKGDAGCYAQQSLVLVNYGLASGNEIYMLAQEIAATVMAKFGVVLENEVNVIN